MYDFIVRVNPCDVGKMLLGDAHAFEGRHRCAYFYRRGGMYDDPEALKAELLDEVREIFSRAVTVEYLQDV